jgi:hypothetical protein
MSAITVLQLAAVALTLAVAGYAIYATKKLHKTQREFQQLLQRVESDSQALQKIAVQIEAGVAAVNEGFRTAMAGAVERQSVAMDNLRDYLDSQEQKLNSIVEGFSESIRALPQPPQAVFEVQPTPVKTNLARLRRESLRDNPELRFSVLKEWFSVNVLAILHRASRGWSNATELIVNVPTYLEPQAELLENSILLIGTRGHAERLAVSLNKIDASSNYGHWFESAINGHPATYKPAVVIRSSSRHFDLVTKGTSSYAFTN